MTRSNSLAQRSESGDSVVRDLHATSLDQILSELSSSNAEHFHADRGHSASRTLNLVVAASELDTLGVIGRRLDSLGPHHPSRTVVLVGHTAERLDAQISIDCHVGPEGGPGFCHDRIVLMCDSKRLAHADSIVGKLRVVGLPTVVWIGSDLTESVEAPLVSVADHLVIDSQREDASQALGHASQLARRRPVHDLAWGRLAIWRRHIASAFEPSSAFRLLANLDSVGVAYSEGAEGVVALLWGWIAQRLGLSLKELRLGTTESVAQATSKIQSVGFHGAKQTESTPSGVIQEVCFRAGQDTIEIGLTHPQRSDVFADSLHPVDTFALGYDGALFQAYDALGMR